MSTKDTVPNAEPEGNGGSSKSSTPQSKSGWDGKLRVNKQATLANPEALSDPDYSDEDAPPVDQIEADEDINGLRIGNRRPALSRIDNTRSPPGTLQAITATIIQRIELPPELASTLEELELYDNLVKHIDGLQDFTHLQILDLSYNKLKHIKNLAHLTKLHHLYFVQNRLSNIENLEALTELVYLELGANRIREIQGLETLTKLEHLWLGQNRITELKGLDTLTRLRTLSIQANRLTSLSGLEALPQLTELYVSDNRITSLEPLRANSKLEILDFQTNPISSLAGLEDLKALENLWASNCEIEDFREIERALRDKEKLEEVYFEGNPVQKQGPVLYRNKIRLTLPQVLKIDAAYVKVA
ncbi:protein phosphatase regulatory subunit Sds22 [Friedmanniomyces endolithicus]|nr:protein phosphatase regulatory subunit Sds22 [Friedmanniomyces endolithicus]